MELFFSPAQSEQSVTVTIPIINDDVHEETEQFTLQLSLPSGSTGVVLDQDSATVQIVDEDREYLKVVLNVNFALVCAPLLQE